MSMRRMKLIGFDYTKGSKYLAALGLALLLSACQTVPQSGDEGDSGLSEEAAVQLEDGAEEIMDESLDTAGFDGSESFGAVSDLLSQRIFYFDFDRAKVKTEAFDSLDAHAQYLLSNPDAQVRLEGHADERGTPEYNIALGERRGKAVSKFMQLSGVPMSQMEVISYGEEKPMVYGQNERAWAENRRVELVYTSGAP